MQATKATRLLRAGLVLALGHNINAAATLATRAIYSNPSPRQLSCYILHAIGLGAANGTNGSYKEVDSEKQQQNNIKALYSKYTQNLVKSASSTVRPEASETEQTVILTGSTGMLGSYMLDALAHSPRVHKIICLNRPDDGGAAKQAITMKERGLDTSYRGKAEFYHIDASQPYLGLSQDLYARLLQEADRVVLNAWPVNFNMPVASFEPHIRGVRNWADFAATASKRVAVVFVSSVATVGRWPEHPVPEEKLDDPNLSLGGYGASKFVASLVLEDAAKAGDFPATALRQGQIPGPERDAGVWNPQEWFPSLVASSLYIKALPSNLGPQVGIDWTPVERIANLVLGIDSITYPIGPKTISGYYHGVNPSTTPWSMLAQALQDFYGPERLPETVSMAEWVSRLEKTQNEEGSSSNLYKNPGVKLLDTYRRMAYAGMAPAGLEMTRTVKQSPTMRKSGPVTPELWKQWCKHRDF